MSLPLSIFLYIYLAFLAIWLVFSAAAIFHMLKFGFKTPATLIVTVSYLAVSAIILFASAVYASQIDWQKRISVLPWLEADNRYELITK